MTMGEVKRNAENMRVLRCEGGHLWRHVLILIFFCRMRGGWHFEEHDIHGFTMNAERHQG